MKTILQDDTKRCYFCGKSGGDNWHHIFNGAYKKNSEDDGMIVRVHATCHRFIHDHSMTALTLKKRAQKKWEEVYGSRDEFIKRYGRNYL